MSADSRKTRTVASQYKLNRALELFLNEPSQCGHVGTGDLFITTQTPAQTPAAAWQTETLLCAELFLIIDFNLLSDEDRGQDKIW